MEENSNLVPEGETYLSAALMQQESTTSATKNEVDFKEAGE